MPHTNCSAFTKVYLEPQDDRENWETFWTLEDNPSSGTLEEEDNAISELKDTDHINHTQDQNGLQPSFSLKLIKKNVEHFHNEI